MHCIERSDSAVTVLTCTTSSYCWCCCVCGVAFASVWRKHFHSISFVRLFRCFRFASLLLCHIHSGFGHHEFLLPFSQKRRLPLISLVRDADMNAIFLGIFIRLRIADFQVHSRASLECARSNVSFFQFQSRHHFISRDIIIYTLQHCSFHSLAAAVWMKIRFCVNYADKHEMDISECWPSMVCSFCSKCDAV